jgi:hypothetical protein
MDKQKVLDTYFIETRAKMLDVAALLDRLHRAEGPADYRGKGLAACLDILCDEAPDKTRRALEALSDPTESPIDHATTQGASGAWAGRS